MNATTALVQFVAPAFRTIEDGSLRLVDDVDLRVRQPIEAMPGVWRFQWRAKSANGSYLHGAYDIDTNAFQDGRLLENELRLIGTRLGAQTLHSLVLSSARSLGMVLPGPQDIADALGLLEPAR